MYEDKAGSVDDDHADGMGHHHRRRQQQHPQNHRVYQQYEADYRRLHARQNKHIHTQSITAFKTTLKTALLKHGANKLCPLMSVLK